MKEIGSIRKDVSSYYSETSSSNSLTSYMSAYHAGIKSEFMFFNNKIGFITGLRFTTVYSSIGKSYWSGSDYFYMLYQEVETTTEYLKINEISQESSYIGIPIEVRYFPFRPHLFRLYFKLGGDLSYRLQTKTDVTFVDNAMEAYKQGITDKISSPGLLSSTFYGSVGYRLGRDSKPSISLEVSFPSLIVTSQTSTLVTPISGFGVQLNVQVPLKSKAQ